jgi:RNA polymerase sigma factor (sigma-70 family)
VNIDLETTLRALAPRVLAALLRRDCDIESAEDAVQEALLAAATQWPVDGMPERPDSWLVAVAARRLIDHRRRERAGRRREEALAAQTRPEELIAAAADAAADTDRDDTLTLLAMCCHPGLTPSSQIALTLRAVGGLTTAEIAHAFLVPESTMAQRISRAKQRIRAAGTRFELPPSPQQWLPVVLHVLYLIFNEGYTATAGPQLRRGELTREAIRLTRAVQALLPGDGEVAGLLALMLLTEARSGARTGPDGGLVPLSKQDRRLWNQESVAEGLALIRQTLSRARVGPYQLQATIAAVHAEASRTEETDWPQIVALYQLLLDLEDNPIVRLNHAVAVAMVDGPRAGLALLDPLDFADRLAGHHRLAAVRAHLLELAGDTEAAREYYLVAARRTTSLPEQRYLLDRAAEC